MDLGWDETFYVRRSDICKFLGALEDFGISSSVMDDNEHTSVYRSLVHYEYFDILKQRPPRVSNEDLLLLLKPAAAH